MNISVIGLGKLGLPFAFFIASYNNKVLAFDKNPNISRLITILMVLLFFWKTDKKVEN